jgi:hypothetical protein
MTLEMTGGKRSEGDTLLRDALDTIASRTSNARGDELALAELLALWLKVIGMKAEMQLVSDRRANCVATVDCGPGPPSFSATIWTLCRPASP